MYFDLLQVAECRLISQKVYITLSISIINHFLCYSRSTSICMWVQFWLSLLAGARINCRNLHRLICQSQQLPQIKESSIVSYHCSPYFVMSFSKQIIIKSLARSLVTLVSFICGISGRYFANQLLVILLCLVYCPSFFAKWKALEVVASHFLPESGNT